MLQTADCVDKKRAAMVLAIFLLQPVAAFGQQKPSQQSTLMPPLAPSFKRATGVAKPAAAHRQTSSAAAGDMPPAAPAFHSVMQNRNTPMLYGTATTYGATADRNAVFSNPLYPTYSLQAGATSLSLGGGQPVGQTPLTESANTQQANSQALKGAARVGVSELFSVAGHANLGGTGALINSLHCPLCKLLSQ